MNLYIILVSEDKGLNYSICPNHSGGILASQTEEEANYLMETEYMNRKLTAINPIAKKYFKVKKIILDLD